MARKANKPETKAFVRIQSNATINVTMGLQNQDVTNADAHVPDRLKVNPLWPKLTVLIRQGVHWYPSEIAEWPTVKALVEDKVLTIGEFSDSCEEQDETQATKDALKANVDNMNARLGNNKEDDDEDLDNDDNDAPDGDDESDDSSLASIAGE